MGEYICNSRTKKDKYLEYIQNFKSIKKKKMTEWKNSKDFKVCFTEKKKERKKC